MLLTGKVCQQKRRYLMTIEDVMAAEEGQVFDRKSIFIKPVDLSDTLCAFANADGGTIAVGISDKTRRIEGASASSIDATVRTAIL